MQGRSDTERRFIAGKKSGVVFLPGGREQCFIDGVPVSRAAYDERFPSKPLEDGLPHVNIFQPMESKALSVHRLQVAEANEQAKRHNTGVKYDPTGRAHIPTREARRREMQVRGLHDNDGCYGDG